MKPAPSRPTTLESFFTPAPVTLPPAVPPPPVQLPIQRPGELNFPPLNPIQAEALRAFMASPRRHGMIVNPVGSGKTVLAVKIWSELGMPSMLVVVPRIVLVQNPWLSELEKLGIRPYTVGQYYSEVKNIRKPITITLYQTLINSPSLVDGFDLIVFDEADVLAGEKFGNILSRVKGRPYVVGLAGTVRDAYDRSLRLQQALPRIIERTISDARSQRMLAPADVIPVAAALYQNEKTEYDRLTEIYRKYVSQARSAKPAERRSFERKAFMVNQSRLALLSNAKDKQQKVVDIVMQDPKASTLIFSSSVSNVRSLQAQLARAGISSRIITADTPKDERERTIDEFGKSYHVLLSVGVLARGYNVPHVTREIIVGATSTSLTALEQRLGRALRHDPNNPGKTAKVFILTAAGTIDAEMVNKTKLALTRLR